MIKPTNHFWKSFKETNGALSCSEALAIMNIADQAPEGVFMELGVAYGKSAMSAAYALKNGDFILVEPEFEEFTRRRNVEKLVYEFGQKVWDVVTIADFSENIIEQRDKYAYVFVDSGSHQDGLPLREVRLLENRMVQGGIIAFHDFRSQFIEVEQAYDYLIGTGNYDIIEINWDEITEYINANNIEEGNVSWHHTELKNPCFVGALKRK